MNAAKTANTITLTGNAANVTPAAFQKDALDAPESTRSEYIAAKEMRYPIWKSIAVRKGSAISIPGKSEGRNNINATRGADTATATSMVFRAAFGFLVRAKLSARSQPAAIDKPKTAAPCT